MDSHQANECFESRLFRKPEGKNCHQQQGRACERDGKHGNQLPAIHPSDKPYGCKLKYVCECWQSCQQSDLKVCCPELECQRYQERTFCKARHGFRGQPVLDNLFKTFVDLPLCEVLLCLFQIPSPRI